MTGRFRNQTTRVLAATMGLMGLLSLGGGCGDWNAQSVSATQAEARSFGTGYQDGFDDGLASWSDYHAGWTWLWTKPETYRKEYDRGWSDGRNLRKLRDRAEKRSR